MVRLPVSLGAVGLALLALGCNTGPDEVACTENLAYGLTVRVTDSVTGVPAGRLATVVAQEGAYQETLLFMGDLGVADSLTFFGAAERAGTYQISVSKAGYQTWTRGGLEVLADVCHVHGVTVDAKLQPAH